MRLIFYWIKGLYTSPWHDGNLGIEHRGRYLVHCEWHLAPRDLEVSARVGGLHAMAGGMGYKTLTCVLKLPRLIGLYLSVCLPAWVASRCTTERTIGVDWNRYGLWWDVWMPAVRQRSYAAWRQGRGNRRLPHG